MLQHPDVSTFIYGSSSYSGYYTFFLPNNQAFTHVTSRNRVLFTESWLYDYGTHYYPSLLFFTDGLGDNYKLMLTMRNLTDRKTGRWNVYAVSNVFERYGRFRRGAVWAKIVEPNIPVENGVVHVIDTVLGVVSTTIHQLLMEKNECTSLMIYLNTIGHMVTSQLAATGGMVTFFAPINEAFDRIPEDVERRLLRNRIWLEQILKLHIVPSKELTSDQIHNETVVNTFDNLRQLYFRKVDWPKNNITYYVIGGGVTASIWQEDVAAVNGIIHYIDRVLGVPYQNMYDIMRNETGLKTTFYGISHMNLRYTLAPWEVLQANQNFTFFAPSDEAWTKVPLELRAKFFDGKHWSALQFVMKRHLIQGVALMYSDLRERAYIMMNDQRVLVQRRGRYLELYWPYGNIVARVQEGGQIAAINGFIHVIDNVLVLEEDLKAASTKLAAVPFYLILAASFYFILVSFNDL
ncbi:unnamed protein product [Soboliphyme baturini]|uniref:FAS1 domain-containing protein n=1 Tax=Soboliphyme baturini TaxID=241478 RepID=A0A183ITY9_9BILA|nr:unnamed protein product [Soboliphyme baturini]